MKTPPSHYSFNNKNNMSVSTGVFGGSALSRVHTLYSVGNGCKKVVKLHM